jgi:uncharacterized protein (DUF608 family)
MDSSLESRLRALVKREQYKILIADTNRRWVQVDFILAMVMVDMVMVDDVMAATEKMWRLQIWNQAITMGCGAIEPKNKFVFSHTKKDSMGSFWIPHLLSGPVRCAEQQSQQRQRVDSLIRIV